MKQLKNMMKMVIVLIAGVVLTGCVSQQSILTQAKKRDEITWGIDVESGLFGQYNIASQEIEGFDADIARAITTEILGPEGTAKFVEVVGKTRVPMLKTNGVDVIAATLTITDERAKVVDFSTPYFTAGQALLVPKGSSIKELSDMDATHTLIMVKGTTSDLSVKEHNTEVKTIAFESYAEAFVALQSGQGDAMTSDNSILFTFAKEDPSYIVLPTLFTTEYYGLAVDKNQTAFLEEINAALENIKESGIYDEIYQKWIPTEDGNE